MNRDAQTLATPEAQVLREIHTRFSPMIAFNLHDQSLSSVGDTTRVAALSLLAPPYDANRSIDSTRLRAMRIAASLSHVLFPLASGHLTQYTDEYEARAFGDRVQSWGTSTILIESGHWTFDPEKTFIRKLNFVGLLAGMTMIGNRSFEQTELHWYFDLQPNGKRLFDVVVRGVVLAHSTGWTHTVDVGMIYEPRKNNPEGGWPVRVVIKAVGDLRAFGGLRELNAHGIPCDARTVAIERSLELAEIEKW
jgi:hypothetical protein